MIETFCVNDLGEFISEYVSPCLDRKDGMALVTIPSFLSEFLLFILGN